MLSVLFMTVFSATEPMRFVQQNKATLFVQAGLPNPAVASTKDGKNETAQSYFDALSEAKGLTNLTDGEKTVGSFTISAFTTKAGNALLKFWKNMTDGTKTVLSCVIDLSSVGKKESDVGTADKIQESWLSYFWRLWSGKDETFKDAKFTHDTQVQVDTFQKNPIYKAFKNLIPRKWAFFNEDQIKAAKKEEDNKYVPALLRLEKTGFSLKELMESFRGKFLILEQDGTTINQLYIDLKTAKEFLMKDDNDPENPTQGYTLNVEFWKFFYDNTLLEIASGQFSKEDGDTLVTESLEKVAKLAGQYKTRK
jgi:hypothetical protein